MKKSSLTEVRVSQQVKERENVRMQPGLPNSKADAFSFLTALPGKDLRVKVIPASCSSQPGFLQKCLESESVCSYLMSQNGSGDSVALGDPVVSWTVIGRVLVNTHAGNTVPKLTGEGLLPPEVYERGKMRFEVF